MRLLNCCDSRLGLRSTTEAGDAAEVPCAGMSPVSFPPPAPNHAADCVSGRWSFVRKYPVFGAGFSTLW